jgi:hypothetical protein
MIVMPSKKKLTWFYGSKIGIWILSNMREKIGEDPNP